MDDHRQESRRKRERRKEQVAKHSRWDGVDRRKGERREQNHQGNNSASMQLDPKRLIKLERREKERKISEKRKQQRLRKELGV